MAKAIWSGTVQFGLVSIPVKMTTAVSSKDPKFNQINSKTGHRINQKRVDAVTGDEVPYDDIVKGTEVGPKQYVTVTEAELGALDPVGSKTVEIDTFIDPSEIDPVLFEKAYYLEPEESSKGPYALLLEAMRKTGKAAIGTFVMRSKQYVTCMWPHGNSLAISTMHWHDEVRPAPEVKVDIDARQLDMAIQLVESLAGNFDPTQYTDEYRTKVMNLIEAKIKGTSLPAPTAAPAVPMKDLLASLEASIQQSKKQAKDKATQQAQAG